MVRIKRGRCRIVFAIFLLIFLSILFTASAETTGCYTNPKATEDLYCVSGLTDTQAKADCDKDPSCKLDQYFTPQLDCKKVDTCQKVTCDTDCQEHTQGKCTSLGGKPVSDEEYTLKCSPGCCKVGNFCQYNLIQSQCFQQAKLKGLPTSNAIFEIGPPMDAQLCAKNICALDLKKVDVKITVVELIEGKESGIKSAKITFDGISDSALTDTIGEATLQLNPGIYLLKVTPSSSDYLITSLSITVKSDQENTQKVILQKAQGTGKLTGIIKEKKDDKIPPAPALDALITWDGPIISTKDTQKKTDKDGKFTLENIPLGKYTLTISKIGYASLTKTIDITQTPLPEQEFILELTSSQIVKGIVFNDKNKNNIQDKDENGITGAKILVDGVIRGFSTSDGKYQIPITLKSKEGTEKHSILAIYAGTQSKQQDFFDISKGKTTTKDFPLIAYKGICVEGVTKPVDSFTASHVPGKKEILLQWLKPCPELLNYELKIIEKSTGKITTINIGPTQLQYIDENVQWKETYTYELLPNYEKSNEKSPLKPITQTTTLGDKECENKFTAQGPSKFCLTGNSDTRKTIWICTDQNALEPYSSCKDKDTSGDDYNCAQLTSTFADCKNADLCKKSGNPFGLYYQQDLCYGTTEDELTKDAPDTKSAKNFCYLDYTPTILDSCNSCTSVNSCFDYKSKSACQINNCLSTSCQWLNGADNPSLINYNNILLPTQSTAETGAGYCLPKTYDNDDKCALCSPNTPPSSLFENHYCTADICSSLGRCFSDSNVKECTSCGKIPAKNSNCYTYTTQKECANNENIEIINGIIKPSKDKCGWNRCRWTQEKDISGANCIKDSDGDETDDCESFTLDAERLACKIDITPPKTTIKKTEKNILSFGHPNTIFTGDDSAHTTPSQRSPLSTLNYCLTSAQAGAQTQCTKFSTVTYNGNKVQAEELNVAILQNSNLLTEKIPGAIYSLQFYSTDKYHNQEELQQAFFYVDTLLPEFEIITTPKTTADTTTLNIALNALQEPATCSITLTSLLPQGEQATKTIAHETQVKEVSFDNLKSVKYNISASCTDDQANTNTKEKEILIDLDQNIDVIYPAFNDVISKTELAFKIHTDVAATCALYNTKTQEKIIEFNIIDDIGKEHETPVLDGFIEKAYIGEHKILCNEVIDPTKTHTDYFTFTVDFTPPQTQITLTEGKRIEMPITYGWQEFFISKATVAFECTNDGYPCDKTYYCQGSGCESIKNTNYKEYTTAFEVTNSSSICYYSTDLGKTIVYQPSCGLITIDGYGINLEKPLLHYYNNQQWGVSNTLPFLWQFSTRIPTTQCKYDFEPDFSYTDIPSFRILQPTAQKNYQVPLFPNESGTKPYEANGGIKELYIRCENSDGELSPQQKMNLEYDPTPPTILETKATPNPVIENIKTTLSIKTDDKTLCKFSDKGHTSYESMPYAFPGAEPDISNTPNLFTHTPAQRTLTQSHTVDFFVNNFVGLKKNYPLTFRCKNGAGDLTNLTTLNITVDYSQLGGILSFNPNKETYATPNINLQIITSKKAKCTYSINGTKTSLDGLGTTTHSKSLTNLKEGTYQYPFSCTMGEHTTQGVFDFTIDQTFPQITSVEDGKFTCGATNIALQVYSNKKNITQYYYEVYDVGIKEPETTTTTPALNAINSTKDYISYYTQTSTAWKPSSSTYSQTSSSNSTPPLTPPLPPDEIVTGTLVLNATIPYTAPILIPTQNLNITHTYITRVKAQDLTGRWSAFVASSGIMNTNKNYSTCANDTKSPIIDFTANETCTSTFVELHCSDEEVGCTTIKYGQSLNAKDCTPTSPYNGEKIEILKSGTICYITTDYTNNSHSSLKTYTQKDLDGDGIADTCDQCSKTALGKTVDNQGCASDDLNAQDKKKDTDGDGLPDQWEQQYHAENCELDYKNPDSNGDGIKDTDEDYDLDESSNYVEYQSYQDPCVKDGIPSKIDEEQETEKQKDKSTKDITTTTESSLLPWVFLFLGLFLIAGGVGYLIYYYKYSPRSKSSSKNIISSPSTRPTSLTQQSSTTKTPAGLREKFMAFERKEQDKLKNHMRESVFSTFSKDSSTIPHIDNIIQKKTDTLPALQQAAQKYADHKEEIKPGLKPAERSVFDKLENIAQKTQDKKIEDVVSQKQADDLFAKLRQISDKRKTTKK